MKCFSLLQRLSVLLLVGASVGVFQSCCDYEDEVANIGNSSGIKVGEIVPGSGKRILEVGANKYYYTADGFLDYVIQGGYRGVRWDFSSNKVVGKYEIEDEDSKTYNKIDANLAFNEMGYLSKMSYDEIYEYEEKYGDYGKEVDKTKGSFNLSYDSEGHLVKIIGNSSEEDSDGILEGQDIVTQVWSNGLLMENKWETVYSSDESYITITTYDYGDKMYINKYKQYILNSLNGGWFDDMGYIGLLGKGPEFLPESVTITEINVYDESEYTYSYSYEFNEDGTIYCVKTYGEYEEDNSTDYYTYGTYEDQLNMDENETKSTRSGKRVNRNFLFGKHFMR